MPSTNTTVQLSLPRQYVGQILDGIEVLIEQWEATASYFRTGEVGDTLIRECSGAEEAEGIVEFYREIAESIRGQLQAGE